MIHVVGGVYWEQCAAPTWDVVLGSGGRAAACLSTKRETSLHTFISQEMRDGFDGILRSYDFTFNPIVRDYGYTFRYLSPLILH